MINTFRIVSMIEGISFLLLLFVAMPAKYFYGYPQAVSVMGLTHGLLYLLFSAMAMTLGQRHSWSGRDLVMVFMGGSLPFGCFFLDRKLRKASQTMVYERS